MPPGAPTSAELPRHGTSQAHAASPTSNEAEPNSVKIVSSTPSEHGPSSPTSKSIAAESRNVDSAHEQSSQEACASLGTAGAEPRSNDDEIASSRQIAGYSWQLPPGMKQDACIMMWVGADDVPALTHLHLTFNK